MATRSNLFTGWEGSIDTTTLAAAATGLLVLLQIVRALYGVYHDPLRAIPGPSYARFTDLWLKFKTISAQRMYYVQDMHQLYGPVVRIGTSEVAFSDLGAFKDIHRIGGGFIKDSWYRRFSEAGVDIPENLFVFQNLKEHARHRKLFSHQFSLAALRKNWEEYISKRVKDTVQQMKRAGKSEGKIDVMMWWELLAHEVIVKLAFGEDYGLIEGGKLNQALEDLRKFTSLMMLNSEFPKLVKILRAIPLASIREPFIARTRFYSLGVTAARKALDTKLHSSFIFSRMIAEQEAEGASGWITEEAIAGDSETLIGAGSGTISVALTYIVWAVARFPGWQKNLEDEVAQLAPDYTDADLEKLPILNVVIHEALRVYAPAPGCLRRITPSGGAMLHGYTIPENTVVQTQAYSMHRNAAIFPDPEKFDPNRFLADPETTQARKAALVHFGGGTRICVGMYLAQMELRHGVAAYFRECRGTKVHPLTTDESMRQMEFFGMTPVAHKCFVTFDE